MSKITLDDLMQSSSSSTALDTVDKEEIIQSINQEVSTISPEKRQEIDTIKDKIDLTDTQALMVYGSNTQAGIASFSETILKEVRAKDAGDVGDLMTDLMIKVKDINVDSLADGQSFIDKLPIIGKGKSKVERFIASYDSLAMSIDKIEAQLLTARNELLKNIGTMDRLYDQNLEYFNKLEAYIIAGEEKIKEAREEILPALHEEARQSEDMMAVQVVRDFEDSINRFEKKVFDLKTSKTLAIQTAPQIKLIQNNDRLLADKVSDSINNVIPLWKSQVVIALGMYRQGKVLDMQKSVSDTTNAMIRQNAEKLRQNTVETAQETQRSTVDLETLKYANDQLIATIEESLEINENARNQRAQAEVELMNIEEDLRRTLLEASNRSS